MPHILSSFVSGKSENGWAMSFSYEPPDRAVLLEKGTLFCMVSMADGTDKKVLLSNTIFTNLSDSYYSSGTPDILECLKGAFANAFDLIGECELFACVSFETKIIAVARGGASIILFRGGAKISLLTHTEEEQKAVSGFIKPGDIFVLGTKEFFEVVPDSMLVPSISSRDPESISEFLTPILDVHDNGQIGALFLKVEEPLRSPDRVYSRLPQRVLEEPDSEDPEFVEPEVVELVESPEPIESIDEPEEQFPIPKRPGPSLSEKPLYLKARMPLSLRTTKKTPMVLGTVFVLLLIGSIVFGNKKLEENKKEEAFQTKVTEIEGKLNESVNLAHINPQRARELFGEAKDELTSLSGDESHAEKIEELQKKQSDFQKEVLGEEEAQLSLYVDLSLLSDGFSASEVTTDNGNMYVFDSVNKKLSKVSLSSKRAEIIAGPQVLENVDSIASYVDTLYGLGRSGVEKIPSGTVIIPDKYDDALISSYAGNVYVLDKNDSAVYRYPGASTPKSNWLTEGVEPNVSDAIQMIIDGTIWVLKANGELKRFSNGNPVVFSLYGTVPPVTHPTSFYTDENSDNLYVLDPENSRIIIATKGGEFVSQYVSDTLKTGKFIAVSEEDEKIFVVTEDKVFIMEAGK
jgi:hypothetical protein